MNKSEKMQIPVIKEENTKEFIISFNKNKVSKEFLDSCKKAGELFKSK